MTDAERSNNYRQRKLAGPDRDAFLRRDVEKVLAWRAKPENRVKYDAQQKLNREVRAGRITRPTTCEQCGKTPRRIEGSHDDYSKPLEVIWLCGSCHRTKDRKQYGPKS